MFVNFLLQLALDVVISLKNCEQLSALLISILSLFWQRSYRTQLTIFLDFILYINAWIQTSLNFHCHCKVNVNKTQENREKMLACNMEKFVIFYGFYR